MNEQLYNRIKSYFFKRKIFDLDVIHDVVMSCMNYEKVTFSIIRYKYIDCLLYQKRKKRLASIVSVQDNFITKSEINLLELFSEDSLQRAYLYNKLYVNLSDEENKKTLKISHQHFNQIKKQAIEKVKSEYA